MKLNTVDISVIIPMYRGRQYVEHWLRILESNFFIVKQNFGKTCESIFVNDCPEERIEIDHEWVNKLNIKVFNLEKNRGIHGARVYGYLKSSGKYIVFIDQDDEIESHYLLSQLSNIGNADAVVCNGYHKRFCILGKKLIYSKIRSQDRVKKLSNFIEDGCQIISPGQVLIRRESIPEVWINSILKKNGVDDWFLWLLMLKQGKIFCENKEMLYTHIDHGDNTSKNLFKMKESADEMIEILEEKNIFQENELEKIKEHIRTFYDLGKNRLRDIMTIYDYWMYLKIREQNIDNYFVENGLKRIAIYGLNVLGNRLYDELKYGKTKVLFGIDKAAAAISYEIPIFSLEEREIEKYMEMVDAVVVTPISAYEEIKKDITEKFSVKVISFKDIIIQMIEQYMDKMN